MSVETTSVEQMGRELGRAITDLPEYEAFEEARASVEADEEVQAAISEFEQLRQEFMVARQTGRADQEQLERVQEAQEDLHQMPVLADSLDAPEDLQERLEAINEAISAPLAVDFGGEAGGCCQD